MQGPEFGQVKCDERPGQCGNCARLRLVCSGYTSSIRANTQEDKEDSPESSKRKRTYRSCIACRTSKTKCSGERPICQRCQRKGTSCVYSESCQPNWIQRVEAIGNNPQSGLPTPTALSNESPIDPDSIQPKETCPASQSPHISSEPLRPSLEWYKTHSYKFKATQHFLTNFRLNSYHLPNYWEIGQLVEEYFNNIHPLRCFAFIHRPSFLQRLDKEESKSSQNYALLYIICALGAQ